MKPIEQQLIIFDIASIQNGFRLNTCRNDPNAGKLSDSHHSGEGQNPSQRECRPLKWIPAYAGMTTRHWGQTRLIFHLRLNAVDFLSPPFFDGSVGLFTRVEICILKWSLPNTHALFVACRISSRVFSLICARNNPR